MILVFLAASFKEIEKAGLYTRLETEKRKAKRGEVAQQ